MKKAVTFILAGISPLFFMGSTLTLTHFSCFDDSFKEKVHVKQFEGKSFSKDINVEKGQSLDIDLKTGGSLKITGWDKNVVSVKGSSGGDYADINIEKTSTGVAINSDFQDEDNENSSDIELEIMVPDEFNLELQTMGGGITLANIKGDFNGKTMGGGLDLSKLNGDIDLETMGGDIHLYDSHLDGRVHTMGGKVLLENVSGGVKGTSMGGNVQLKNVDTGNGKSTKDKVIISTMGGEINVDSAPNGADLTTMGGDININTAAGFVKAKTMGGDVILEEVNGGVKATTMGGDIKVNITGGNEGDKDIDLSSMGGTVYLTVPADFSMDIDITLAYTKHHEGDYQIKSDFNLDKKESGKWESHRGGTPRKFIYGTGKTGDGRHRVKIETINGDVVLKRG